MTTATSGISSYQLLEQKYSEWVGQKYGVAVNTGTAALHLALVALGIGPGDEVIVPDFTMAACGFAVSYVGAKVVTVDCGLDLNIKTSKIQEKITPKTKAILAVHIYGRLCNMTEIMQIARTNGLYVIEDACEAQGAVYDSLADATCWSFYKNKIIHAEEGGMVTTNNLNLAKKMQYLKCMAFNPEHNYYHEQIGFNYRMPDLTALQVLESLQQFPENFEKRQQIEAWFDAETPKAMQIGKHDTVWVYDLVHVHKERIITQISSSRHFFKPLSSMPMWKQKTGNNASYYAEKGLYFNVHPEMTQEEVKRICACL